MSTTMSSIHFDEKELKDLDRVFNEIKNKSQSGRIMKDTLRAVFPPGDIFHPLLLSLSLSFLGTHSRTALNLLFSFFLLLLY
jgi:hypothetical protein